MDGQKFLLGFAFFLQRNSTSNDGMNKKKSDFKNRV